MQTFKTCEYICVLDNMKKEIWDNLQQKTIKFNKCNKNYLQIIIL